MALGIAVSGDGFMNYVRSGGEYFIERGEFGKRTVINAAGGATFDKRRRLGIGQTMADRHAGRAGRVHQAPVADGLRSLSDDVVPGTHRRRRLPRLHAEAQAVGEERRGAGHANAETGSAYRARRARAAAADGRRRLFGLDYTRALGMREGWLRGVRGLVRVDV